MQKLKESLFSSPVRYIVSLIITIILTIIVLISRGFDALIGYIDGLGVSGFVIILVGGLSIVSYFGFFDTVSYGFSTIGRREKRKYEDLVDYKNKANEKRKGGVLPFLPYFVCGILLIIISFILRIFL